MVGAFKASAGEAPILVPIRANPIAQTQDTFIPVHSSQHIGLRAVRWPPGRCTSLSIGSGSNSLRLIVQKQGYEFQGCRPKPIEKRPCPPGAQAVRLFPASTITEDGTIMPWRETKSATTRTKKLYNFRVHCGYSRRNPEFQRTLPAALKLQPAHKCRHVEIALGLNGSLRE